MIQEQTIPVSLGQGLDTKSDAKHVLPGRLLALQNGVFRVPGNISKRYGFQSLSTAIRSGGSITSGVAAFNFGELIAQEQLLVHDGFGLYSYDATEGKWLPVSGTGGGGMPALKVSQKSLIKTTAQQKHPDMAMLNGFTLVAWEDSVNGGVSYSIFESATGAPIKYNLPLPVTGQSTTFNPKVVTLGNFFLVFFVDGANLDFVYVPTSTLSVAGKVIAYNAIQAAPQLAAYDANTNANGTTVTFASSSSAATIRLNNITIVGGVPTLGGSPATVAADANNCLSIFPDSNGTDQVIAWNDGANSRYAIYSQSLSVVKGPTTIEAVQAAHITGVSVPGSTSEFSIFYDTTAADVGRYTVHSVTYVSHNVALAPVVLMRSVGLASQAFQIPSTASGGATVYVAVSHDSTDQSTIFLIDLFGNVVGKALSGASIGHLFGSSAGSANPLLPEVNPTASSATIAMQEVFSVTSLRTQAAAGVTAVGFTWVDSLQSATLANTLHIASGVLWMYDGISAVEHGFHLFPEGLSVPNPGGVTQYQYVQTYEWMDHLGNLHQSAPSPAVIQAQANPIDTTQANQVTVTCPTLRVTAKSPIFGRANVHIALWRTQGNGTVFFRVLQSTPLNNDPTVDFVTFVDTTTDFQLLSQEHLYITGGVLDNIAPSSSASVTMSGNRLWLIDSTDPLRLWFSKQAIPGNPVEFSDTLLFNLEPYGGIPQVLATLDDKTVVLRTKGVSYIAGLGPDSTGAQNDFDEVQIPVDVGCTDVGSVAVGPEGVWFKSLKGIYMLTRGLTQEYVGADVEAYNGVAVTSAAILRNQREVRFTLANGTALSYDTFVKQWSVFTNVSAVGAAFWHDTYTYLDADGQIHQETPGTFSDDGALIPLAYTTSHLQMAGIQGFQRVWEMLFLGNWITACKIRIDLSYDFTETVTQTEILDFPTVQTPLQFRVHLTQEQCEAIQITLTELDSGVAGEGFTLTDIALKIGAHKGPFKLPASQSFG